MDFAKFQQGLTKREEKAEIKAPKYNTQLFGSLDNTKTVYNEGVGCDMYVVANVPHFKTGKANDKHFEGFDTLEDAYKAICVMAQLGVPGIYHIGQTVIPRNTVY